jgi:TPR repeat protein
MEALKGLYHADKLDQQSFVDNFTIRLKEFRQIIDNLLKQKKRPLQHFLITGKRGMGKSTLLRRIDIEVSNSLLKEKIIPVRLGAEQYRLSRLFKLWEMVIEHLGKDEPELLVKKSELENSRNYEDNLLPVINDHLTKTGKTLLLLIDNFDQFIEKIPAKDTHALREALMQHPIQVIGNSVFYNEHFKSYDQPFFDFFRPIHLGNLDKDEAEEFIKLRAKNEGIDDFDQIFQDHKGKISALRILSGGVPRTLLILLSIVFKKNAGDAVDYLHEMIVQVTPLYQDRMKALSSQQQEIMHHLAMHWDRTPVKELATAMRIPSKSISSQLLQLEKIGYIKKVDIPGRNHYYEIDERFFNIWLLMSEAAPYDAKRVIWLTKWLDAVYSNDELESFAGYCQIELKKIKPQNRFLIVQALTESKKLEENSKVQLVNEMAEELKSFSEVQTWAEGFKRRLADKKRLVLREVINLIQDSQFDEALNKLNQLESDDINVLMAKGYFYSITNSDERAEVFYQMAAERGSVAALLALGTFYRFTRSDIEKAEKYLLLAAEGGVIGAIFALGVLYENDKKDLESAKKYYKMAVSHRHVNAMLNLGILYHNNKDTQNARKFYQMAVEEGDTDALVNLGVLSEDELDITNAEKYYLLAANKGNVSGMYNLGVLYRDVKMDITSASKYLQMSAQKGDTRAMIDLADIYHEQKSLNQAEKYYQMAVDGGNSAGMVSLGMLYEIDKKDIEKAEHYYQLAVDHGHVEAMMLLAGLYFAQNNTAKANAAYELSKKAVEITEHGISLFEISYISILLWNKKVKDAGQLMLNILKRPLNIDDNLLNVSAGLQYFIIFKQRQLLYQIFSQSTEWIDRYKPIYYALLHEMQDENLKEYLKMPPELQEPVNAILQSVRQERQRLGIKG